MIFNLVFIVLLAKKSKNIKHTSVWDPLEPVRTRWDLLEHVGTR
jgi:hypothetical protein